MISTEVPYDPAAPLLDIYLRETETWSTERPKQLRFTAALFIIAQKWEKPEYPSTDEWINKTEYDEKLFPREKE